MGMFNSIYADVLCPAAKRLGKNTEIQIKWQKQEARLLDIYHIGDVLKDIEPEFDNNWIKTDYICEVCSEHTQGYKGEPFIKTADQKRHFIFVHVVQGQIKEILTEEEFQARGIKNFVDDCW